MKKKNPEEKKNQKTIMAFPMNTITTKSWNVSFYHNQALQCNSTKICYVKPLNCQPDQQQVEWGVLCESCSGKGWLVCDVCKGQKMNVKAADSNRIYRRCPACKAIGSLLCSKCKVYRCVTFPDQNDGVELNF